ncbi:MAG: PilN domain-containing protein [Myxococcales bacterium]|nr:PilN domain-containing protein [Myxococcales bacterium]
MMIRINLLPVRQVKKRELGRQVLVLFGAVLLLAGVVNYLWYSHRQDEWSRRHAQIADTERRIAELEKVIGEVNNINKRKKEVEDKLKILTELRKGRSGPVRLLDALATATPKKVWITEFNEKSNLVKITGVGVSHDDVAEFMRSLSHVVWTPKGLGRLIEQKSGQTSARVELLSESGAIDEFGVGEVSPFFTAIELRRASQGQEGGAVGKQVSFEINLQANYAI